MYIFNRRAVGRICILYLVQQYIVIIKNTLKCDIALYLQIIIQAINALIICDPSKSNCRNHDN